MGEQAGPDILEQALAALEKKTGLRGQISGWTASDPGLHRWYPDAQISIQTPAGQYYSYLVELKYRVDRIATLAQVRNAARGGTNEADNDLLLVTPHLTSRLLDACRLQLDLQAIDMAGNAYLKRPGLYVCSRGERLERSLLLSQSAKAGGAGWLRVVYALITDPDIRGAPYREIATISGVSLGTVSTVLRDLEDRHLLLSTPSGRRIVEPTRLVQEWIAQYPTRLRPKLRPKLLRVENPDWWQTAVLPEGAYWGGDVAATRMTHYLKPVDAIVYVQPTRRDMVVAQLVREYRLRSDKSGNVEILDLPLPKERPGVAPDVVHPLLLYADLLSTVDPRHREVAEMVRDQYLHDLLGA